MVLGYVADMIARNSVTRKNIPNDTTFILI